ncbi:MAG: 50S ribosomal protein L35 [Clostridia bacterium]|jgi:large subunit ribosomal protein L35|nr:50S ribosomal protein L35 [Clostridia bacterium]MDD3232343.1 50S ribosomal protein L35 [Clostridia bacterium]MDD3862245.1 50S ribosomal protein L35 [Clostridia bacterium]
MPKIKSHSGAKKRFSVNPKGKVKYASTDRGHFMTEKSQDRKRKLRKGGYLSGKQAKTVKKLIQN